jgi:hypothetical protein
MHGGGRGFACVFPVSQREALTFPLRNVLILTPMAVPGVVPRPAGFIAAACFVNHRSIPSPSRTRSLRALLFSAIIELPEEQESWFGKWGGQSWLQPSFRRRFFESQFVNPPTSKPPKPLVVPRPVAAAAEHLFETGTAEAKSYALVGLYNLNRTRFSQLAATLRSSKAEVLTAQGYSQNHARCCHSKHRARSIPAPLVETVNDQKNFRDGVGRLRGAGD